MNETFQHLLNEKATEITDAWRQRVLASYPSDAAQRMLNKDDPFSNPIGHTVSSSLPKVFEALIDDEGVERLSDLVDGIVRMRAVQDFSASQAVAFAYQLKGVLRETLADAINDADDLRELMAFEDRVDRLAIAAFDAYSACREQLYQLRTHQPSNPGLPGLEQDYFADRRSGCSAEGDNCGGCNSTGGNS